MFSITGIIANIIPNVPYQVDRQVQLEKTLLKEDNFKKNSSKKQLDDYDKFLSEIRGAHNSTKLGEVVRRGTWARKISRRLSTVSFMKPVNDFNESRKSKSDLPRVDCFQ